MKRYVLDTGIVLHFIRGSKLYSQIEKDYNLTGSDNSALISIATKGELFSLAKKRNWTNPDKLQKLKKDLDNAFIIIDINNEEKLLQAYSDIDAYSQGKLAGKPSGLSSRNMGKNDLWIAATAYVTNSTLITTDGDFDHLNGTFINVIKYS